MKKEQKAKLLNAAEITGVQTRQRDLVSSVKLTVKMNFDNHVHASQSPSQSWWKLVDILKHLKQKKNKANKRKRTHSETNVAEQKETERIYRGYGKCSAKCRR